MAKDKTNKKSLPLIIGITGTIGSGKGTAVEYLVQEQGFSPHSVREYLKEHLDDDARRRREEPKEKYEREEYQQKANYLRANHHEHYIIEQLYFRVLRQEEPKAIIESVRNVGEIKYLRKLHKEKKAKVRILAIDAHPELRYQRIQERNSDTDKVSYEQFLAQEQTELKNTNPTKQNLLACMKKADYKLQNNASVKELHQSLEEIFI